MCKLIKCESIPIFKKALNQYERRICFILGINGAIDLRKIEGR